jgi:predicted Zn-dependent protease
MKNLGASHAALVLACLLLVTGCVGRGEYVPIDKQRLKGSGRIYFVPLGDFPPAVAARLVAHYRDKYGLSIETVPAVPLDPAAINAHRQQLIAERAVTLMKGANPELVNQPGAILIGLTRADMYIAQSSWQFTFSWRQEGRYAVVSDARMSLGSTALPAEKVESRLRKMVTKNIGILYYRLPLSDDPRSVLYKDVGGISELDYMGEEF